MKQAFRFLLVFFLGFVAGNYVPAYLQYCCRVTIHWPSISTEDDTAPGSTPGEAPNASRNRMPP